MQQAIFLADDLSKASKQSKRRRESVNDPYKALALAVLLQAVTDIRTKAGSGERRLSARRWLLESGQFWLEACTSLAISPDYWQAWVSAGCPKDWQKKPTGSPRSVYFEAQGIK